MRRRMNDINCLKNLSNQWDSNPLNIQSMFLDHFKTIFQSSFPPIPKDLDNLFRDKITESDNTLLYEIPFDDEILSTIKQISSSKSPGTGGFTCFFL